VTDERPIYTREYRFPQIHKEEINKQVEERGIKLFNHHTPIWIIPKKEDSKGNKE